MERKVRKALVGITIGLSIVLLVLLGILFKFKLDNKNLSENEKEPGEKVEIGEKDPQGEEPVKPDEFEYIRIKAGGDVLIHRPIKNHALNAGSEGKSDFTKNFEEMKDFMNDADYSILNFEGTINPNLPLSDYPMFNVSKDILPTLKEIGIDGLTTANNHCLDSYFEGLETTIDHIDNGGFDYYGTQKTIEDKIKLVDVKGAKLAVLSYTDSLNGMDPVLDTEEKISMVNRVDGETIKKDIEKVREMGADIVIMYPHWGSEYTQKPLAQYVELARNMIDWGADVVCGNHPHVVHPAEWYESESGNKGYIIYSMGNFLSNQRVETMDGDIRTEQSVIVDMYFKKNLTKNTTELKDIKIHPIWVRAYRDEFGGILNQTVLAEEYMEGGIKSDRLNQDQINRATKAYNMTMDTIVSPVQ